jgi:hypothetical protein
MPSSDRLLVVYRDLADWHERQGLVQMRDHFLVLAADAALSAGRSEEAERLRQRLVRGNPQHLLGSFASFAQALQAFDVQEYVQDLRQRHPPEAAETLLDSIRGGPRSPGRTELRTLPPTAPVIDFGVGPLDPFEPLKVYRAEDEAEEPTPPPPAWQEPVPKPAPARATGAKANPTRTAPAQPARRTVVPVQRPPATGGPVRVRPGPPPPRWEENEGPAGAWVAWTLFVLVLAVGLLGVGYFIAQLFLPQAGQF